VARAREVLLGAALDAVLEAVRRSPLPTPVKVLASYLLVRAGAISVGRAAEACGLSYREYVRELRRMGLRPFEAAPP
jgi:hypothetical protein